MRRRVWALLCCVVAIAGAHPFHASTADLTLDTNGQVRIVVRVFTEDLAGVAGASAEAQGTYVASRFELRDRSGVRRVLRVDSVQRERAATRVTMSARLGDPRGARVWHGVLLERFDDQVNILRVHGRQQRRTLVFAAGDTAQALW